VSLLPSRAPLVGIILNVLRAGLVLVLQIRTRESRIARWTRTRRVELAEGVSVPLELGGLEFVQPPWVTLPVAELGEADGGPGRRLRVPVTGARRGPHPRTARAKVGLHSSDDVFRRDGSVRGHRQPFTTSHRSSSGGSGGSTGLLDADTPPCSGPVTSRARSDPDAPLSRATRRPPSRPSRSRGSPSRRP
jgi:hypothetical protein